MTGDQEQVRRCRQIAAKAAEETSASEVASVPSTPVPTPLVTPIPVDPKYLTDELTIDELADIAQRRTRAYREGSLAEFLVDVVRDDLEMRDAEAAIFNGLHSVAAAATWRALGPPEPQDALSERIGVSVAVVHLELLYRIPGIDRHPVARDHTYLAIYSPAGWYLADDPRVRGTRHGGMIADPWDVGPTMAVRNAAGVVVAPVSEESRARAMALRLPVALDEVAEMWPGARSHLPVLYLTEPGPLETTYFTSLGMATAVTAPMATALPGDGRRGSLSELPTRIAIQPNLETATDDIEVARLLTHEITHVQTFSQGLRQPPTWLVEGIAEYTAYRSRVDDRLVSFAVVDEAENGGLGASLPDDQEFYAAWWHYDQAWFLCRYISLTWDEQALKRLVREYGTAPLLYRGAALDDRVLREVLGVTPEAFLEGFGTWAEQEAALYS